MMNWTEIYAPPKSRSIMRSGKKTWENFLRSGSTLARQVHDALASVDALPANGDSLEFGCGAGRVLIPMRHHFGLPTHGCDINDEQIEFLRSRVPEVELAINGFMPPAPYPDDKFALIYAISVWTHLTPADQITWLKEAKRILRPGGILALTTQGGVLLTLEGAAKTEFSDVTMADVEREGIIHRNYDQTQLGASFDVIRKKASAWGRTMQSQKYSRDVFGKEMEVIGYFPACVHGVQDLIVLKKPGGAEDLP